MIRRMCMKCRAPIVQLRRYGRVLNRAAIDCAERKYLQQSELALSSVQAALQDLVAAITRADEGGTAARSAGQLDTLRKQGRNLRVNLQDLLARAIALPTYQAYQASR